MRTIQNVPAGMSCEHGEPRGCAMCALCRSEGCDRCRATDGTAATDPRPSPTVTGHAVDLTDASVARHTQYAHNQVSAHFGSSRPDLTFHPWEPPESLTVTVPSFPVALLPGVICRICTELAETTQTPVDLSVLIAIATLSASTLGMFSVAIDDDWSEPLSVFALGVLAPGNRKSKIVSVLSRPLADEERRLREVEADALAEARALSQVAQHRAKRFREQAAAKDMTPELEADVRAAAIAVERMPEPVPTRFLTDDVTPERLGMLMADQYGAMAVLTAEGSLLSNLAGQYNNKMPNIDLVLQAHAGDPAKVDRVNRPLVDIPAPHLALGLLVQPHVLAEANAIPAFRDRGLLARFLFAVPASPIGSRRIRPRSLPAATSEGWRHTVLGLLTTAVAHRQQHPVILRLDEEGRRRLETFQTQLELRMHPDHGDLAHLVGWSSKLPGALVRLAGLFSLAQNPATPWVAESSMSAAIALADYFIAHAEAAFGVGTRANLEPAAAVLRWLRQKQHSTFTVREAYHGLRGQAWCANTAAVQTALQRLTAMGWLAALDDPLGEPKHAGRPPSPRYAVSPYLSPALQPEQVTDSRAGQPAELEAGTA